MYTNVNMKVAFPKMEEAILDFWKRKDIFTQSIQQRGQDNDFVFYDGPPFATGLPHFGHFVPGTIKDVIPRYKTMRGFKVERRFGWDCHGLPVENLIEKELGLGSKTDIEAFGVSKFNEACRASVLRYVAEWRNVMTRLGRWVDFDNDYKTMDPDYMESIWWVVKALWDKGLLYEGSYILPYCPRCSTVLSNHEIAQGAYKDVHDPAITVRFLVTAAPKPLEILLQSETYLLAWTTTPWTLPSNLALCVGPDIEYCLVNDLSEAGCVTSGTATRSKATHDTASRSKATRYLLAESRISACFKDADKVSVIWKGKGSELVGVRYKPLFPYFEQLGQKGAFCVVQGTHVNTDEGTGIVHTAPGFGEDDYLVLKGSGLPAVCPIDEECKFDAQVPDYQGIFVKDADKAIIAALKAQSSIVRQERILHAYPHCYRCDSPLIYRAVNSWFVDIAPVKPVMLEANSNIHWVPDHIKTGRFGKWLENARDWAISRNRYWGNPLPIWRCDTCKKITCVGSRKELQDLCGHSPADLHKHFIDAITIPCDCGGTMRRIPEVLDCWFESGAMPYAQVHYPFENKAHFEAHYPADFISESMDQTRGWFYTLTVLAAALFGQRAFQHCIVSGLVLGADGKKMSKSQRNYTDPMELIDKYGADALRFYLMNSSIINGDDLCFSDDGVREVVKSVLIPIWNAYGFYVTYATIDGVDRSSVEGMPVNPSVLDRWILSVSEKLVLEVGQALDAYDLQAAIAPLLDFIDKLNNWYIRMSRRRFWRGGNAAEESGLSGWESIGPSPASALPDQAARDSDKLNAYICLQRALTRLMLALAPIMPFVTDEIWRNLAGAEDSSIHLADWPRYDESLRDIALELKMDRVRKAVSMGRALRLQHGIKMRQPLSTVYVVTKDKAVRADISEMEDIVREEINVKAVVFGDHEDDLVDYSIKADYRVLGKELGNKMRAGAALIESLPQERIRDLVAGRIFDIDVDGQKLALGPDKVKVVRTEKPGLSVLNEDSLTIALDLEINAELEAEGCVRDLVRGIQNLRKEAHLALTDRIVLTIEGEATAALGVKPFEDILKSETLAQEIVWGGATLALPSEFAGESVIAAGGRDWKVSVRRASAQGL